LDRSHAGTPEHVSDEDATEEACSVAEDEVSARSHAVPSSPSDADSDTESIAELLLEEVSIDGMCGVY
jgi:mycofactocin precursor